MKKRLILACLLAVALGVFAACAPAAGATASKEVRVDETYAGKEVEIAEGGVLIVTLESNPTTGYQWELSEITGNDILELVSSEFQPAETGLVGAGGTEVWTFKALARGEATINLEYSRPWEGGEKGEKTFSLNVVVK